MFESIRKMFKKSNKKQIAPSNSKDAAKERLHLVLMQDRANVSVDFLEFMKQEIIDVIKKYIEVDDDAIDVRLTNKENGDGTTGAPALYANIPILNIKNEVKAEIKNEVKDQPKKEKSKKEEKVEENKTKPNVETIVENEVEEKDELDIDDNTFDKNIEEYVEDASSTIESIKAKKQTEKKQTVNKK